MAAMAPQQLAHIKPSDDIPSAQVSRRRPASWGRDLSAWPYLMRQPGCLGLNRAVSDPQTDTSLPAGGCGMSARAAVGRCRAWGARFH